MLICVPTPLTRNREPDLGPLTAAGRGTGPGAPARPAGRARVDHLPGYDTGAAGAAARARVWADASATELNVAFSPERVDPGRTDYTLRNTPKVVGGITPECAERAAELYGRVCDEIVRVSTPEAAEMAKLLENIFRSVNIALVNELAILADRMGIDIWEVVDAAATKPYGFMRFEPGPGMGGHCLPVDPFYLTWRAREFHMSTEFIELAGKINQQMPYHCVERIELALNERAEADQRLADRDPRRQLQRRRRRHPRVTRAADHGGAARSRRRSRLPRPLRSRAAGAGAGERRTGRSRRGSRRVVLVTAHPDIDYGSIAAEAALFIDLRGVTRGLRVDNLVRL